MDSATASAEWLAERERLLGLEKMLRAALEVAADGGPQPTDLILEVDQLRSKVNNLFRDVQEEAKRRNP